MLRAFFAGILLTALHVQGAGGVVNALRYGFDSASGGIESLECRDGRQFVKAVETRYFVMSKSGDTEAFEHDDRVVGVSSCGDTTEFRCANPKLPGIDIVKRYRIVNGGLRRTMTFTNRDRETRYVTPFVECNLDERFVDGAYHLGVGYIGPYKPFPKVEQPQMVTEHLQSSKGVVLINPDARRGSFAHYRVKIDDTVVFPWWHSTIGHYREYHDRFWYLPHGYRMGLGTFGLFTGKSVSVTDHFSFFDGNLFAFFDGVFAKDPDFAAELKAIPPPPGWIRDVVANCDDRFSPALQWLLEMFDDGCFMMHIGPAVSYYSWGDYRLGQGGFPTSHGGHATDDELRAHVDGFRRLSPRVHVSVYGIAVAAGSFTGVVKEHPGWFRRHDRDGKDDSLFPGVNLNWQTMFSEPECRRWMAKMFCDFADGLGLDTIYIDETQMTNTIDWDRDRITRDDDTVKFWKILTDLKCKRGKMFFANGSGIPYVDVNYIEECRGTLKPEKWRDGAGVLLGVAMMNRMRKGQRTIPLYWTPGNDYANRVLALGWIPRTHLYAQNDAAVIRAAYQTGHMDPADVNYSPDWKTDPTTDVESYAGRREDSGDVVLSFINRGQTRKDIPVSVDLASMGFRADTRINIFRQHLDMARAGQTLDEMLSDRELKANWRERGVLRGARLSQPELVYSGSANGQCSFVLDGIAPHAMEQLLVVSSPMSLFSVDDLPLNGFYTSQRDVRICDGKVHVGKGRTAEVLLIDKNQGFANVTANGRTVPTRPVRVGDLHGTLVSLGAGDWVVGWSAQPLRRDELAALPVASGILKTTVRPPKRLWYPALHVDEKVNAMVGDARVVRKFAFASCVESSNRLQENSGIGFAAVSADEKDKVLTAGTTRREGEIEGMVNFAGFEIEGADVLDLRFTASFTNTITCDISAGHAASWAMRKDADKVFTGIVIDYRVGESYVKRVALSTGLPKGECSLEEPRWGTGRSPDEFYRLGDWIEDSTPRMFTLNLRKYAPDGWRGGAIVSLGTSRIQCGRTMRLEFRDASTAPDPHPSNAAMTLQRLKEVPPAVAEVRRTPSGAALFVDGKRSNACFYKGSYSFALFGRIGADLVVTTELHDMQRVQNKLLRIYHANTNARVIVSVDLTPPRAFFESHQDEIFMNDQGERGRVKTSVRDSSGRARLAQYDFMGFGNGPLGADETWAFSYSGEAWRSYAKGKLDDLVRMLRVSPAGNIVVGFNFMGGMDGQYVQWEYRPTHGHFDYSEGSRKALCRYLAETYGTDSALQKAWGDSSVTLATAKNPTPDEFRSIECFDDKPGLGRRLADCRRFISVGLARSLNGFARHVKKAWGRPAVVELWWTTAIWPQPARLAIDELVAGGAVDIVKTVSYYAPERSVGGIGASANNLGASLDCRGVLYVQELDHRTRFTEQVDNAAWTSAAVAKPSTPEEFEIQLMRDVSSVIAVGGRGLCFYDMLGGWYRAREESDTIRRAIAMQSLAVENAGLHEAPEAVILLDEQTRLLCEKSVAEQPSAVWRTSGLTPSIRLTSDLALSEFPAYRLYILWNSVCLTKHAARLLKSRAESGAKVVVAGRVGVSSRDFTSQNEAISALGPKVLRIENVKEITPERLNDLARLAGVHVYSKPGNAVYVGNGVACVHRIAEPAGVDFGKTVTPVDPITRKTLPPIRVWRPDVPLRGTAVMCYLP